MVAAGMMAASMVGAVPASFARGGRASQSRSVRRVAAVPVRVAAEASVGQAVERALSRAQKAALAVGTSGAVTGLLVALPALAEEEETKGALFDFDATLPSMVAQFLLLMVLLNTTFYGPVGKVIDERDTFIKDKLASVKGGASETQSLAAKTEAILSEARAEAAKEINAMKDATDAKVKAKLAEAKAEQDKKIAAAMTQLASESQASENALKAEVGPTVDKVVAKVLPAGLNTTTAAPAGYMA